jgi:hypothetical protein
MKIKEASHKLTSSPVLVEGVWDRVRCSNGLVPLEVGGGPDEGFLE